MTLTFFLGKSLRQHFARILMTAGLSIFSVGMLPPRTAIAGVPDEECMNCHEDKELKDGANRPLFVDKAQFDNSIHGRSGISCVSCHTDLENIKDFPHPENLKKVECASCHPEAQAKFEKSVHAKARTDQGGQKVLCRSCHGHHDVLESRQVNSRTHPLQQPATCGTCHFDGSLQGKHRVDAKDFLTSVHGVALIKYGLSNSATCVTCHGSHEVVDTSEAGSLVSRRNVPHTCGRCHEGILRDYLEGVHGQDFERGIKDVPVCTDCHGEHRILSPQDNQSKVYATKVALTCAGCHDNQDLTQAYHLPPGRLRSFQGSFHGVASHFGETRVASCISCHGFHNIRPSSDPKSPVNQANLPNTCGQCHGGAIQRLSNAKIHVLDPKVTNYAGFLIQKFYFYMISTIMGCFVLYIAADLKFRLSRNSKRHSRGEKD
ncbi:MAG: hypothetical protein U0V70_01935 [Terriglobia bacterium]